MQPASTDNNTDVIIEARGVWKSFDAGKHRIDALKGVDLTVRRGEVVAVMGPSGCGKTTLLNCLSGLDVIDRGTVRIAGHDLNDLTDNQRTDFRARQMGFVFQTYNLLPVLTGVENVELFARLFDVPRKERKEKVAAALDAMGLTEAATRLAGTYSGGMIRRLELAQALINAPRLLVLDEPTVGLDPIARGVVWEYIARLRDEHQMTVLMTTHYMDEADAYCDRVSLMHRATIRATGRPADLRAGLGEGATLDDVFRHYTGDTLDKAQEEGGIRDVRRSRRTARRLG